MNASFNAVQGLETEHACYRGQRQGGENTYRAGERLKNLNGYLLAVEYLADIAAVSDHEEHAAERRADIGEQIGCGICCCSHKGIHQLTNEATNANQ